MEIKIPLKLKEKIALIKQEIGKMSKDKSNPFFKSKYFDINQILDELKPLEEKYRIVITQPLTVTYGGLIALELNIKDLDSDDIDRTHVPLPENSDPQKMGSIITYFRRYALVSYFGLQAEDDDGNLGAKKEERIIKIEPTLYEVVENAIENAKDLKIIDTLNKKITDSTKLSDEEKEELINQLTFKSQELI